LRECTSWAVRIDVNFTMTVFATSFPLHSVDCANVILDVSQLTCKHCNCKENEQAAVDYAQTCDYVVVEPVDHDPAVFAEAVVCLGSKVVQDHAGVNHNV